MALTRKFLRAMGIEDEKIEQIIEAHSDTVDGLKNDIATYKENADKLESVQKELDELKAKGDDGYREKYEKEHSDFEAYKADIQSKEAHGKKETAYREILGKAGIKDKFIDTVIRADQAIISELGLVDGKVSDADTERLIKAAQDSWADFVATTEVRGADIATPPVGTGIPKNKNDIMQIKDTTQRQKAWAEYISEQKG